MGCSESNERLNGRNKSFSTRDIVPHLFVSRYELLKQIGEGAFAVVRLAMDKITLKKVAVKITNRKLLQGDGEEYIRREVDIQSSMNHPNIVKLIDFFEEPDYFYSVMEYVEGGELFDRIVQRTTYTENNARTVVHSLLKAISYCHGKGVVHRDIKPENILMSSMQDDAFVKLADFGFAIYDYGTNSLTTACGTPAYVAPEILKRHKYGSAVDMWGIGVVAFILLGGYLPFNAEDEHKRREKIRSAQYFFEPKRWAGVSEDAIDFIVRLFKVNPVERLTAKDALTHPWMLREGYILEARYLGANLAELQTQIKNKKFKAATHAIMALHRLGSASRRGSSLISLSQNVSQEASRIVSRETSVKEKKSERQGSFLAERQASYVTASRGQSRLGNTITISS